MNNQKLSFVIPCYGSEHTIEDVVCKIVATVAEKNPYEIICVNDCSPDGVYKVLVRLAAENKNVKVINLAKNYSQANALMAGFRAVTGDIIITLDDDGQTPPEVCYDLINAIDDDTDVVFARYAHKQHSAFRNWGSRFARDMNVWLSGCPRDLFLSSYAAYKRFVIDEVANYTNPFVAYGGFVFRSTQKFKNVDVEHHERAYGKSGYTLKKLLQLFFNGFTAFSVKPLRVATFTGVAFALFGFLYALYLVLRKILYPATLVGYSSMMCVILVTGGLIMMMLGLIGEYIGRIYINLNRLPQYVIRNTINIDEDEPKE